MHAAEADAAELAAHGARDRLAERGLADAGRADEAQDRALALGLQLAHREIFEDALLDLGQAVMVLVEDAARFGDVDALVGELRPGQLDQPIEVGADHAVLGARPRACARAASAPSAPASRPPPTCRPSRSPRAARRSRPGLPRPRQAPSESGGAARAGCARAAGRQATPASARRSASTGAAPRSAGRDSAAACRDAPRRRRSRARPASPRASGRRRWR